ncbi:MAG: arginine repressor [Lachnospiraceae bacterium]
MRTDRRNMILYLINQYEIETQEELCQRLKNAGYDVTQATVSRDIRAMKITKVVGENGKQKYFLLPSSDDTDNEGTKQIHIFKAAVISVDTAGNILVIKTKSGMAPAVGAVIDTMNIPEIVGSIAGDDTIMCAMKNQEDCTSIMEKINTVLNSSRDDYGLFQS